MMACYKAKGAWFKEETMEGCRVKGRGEGVWSFYSKRPDGTRQLKARAQMKAGKAHGFHREFNPTGRLRLEGQTEDGSEVGTWRGFHPGGQLSFEIDWVAGKRSGPVREWYPNCQLARAGQFKDNQRDGQWTEWFQNGRKRSEGSFLNNQRHGTWTMYDKDGPRLESGPYEADQRQGKWTEFFMNGVTWRTVDYVDDIRQGEGPAKCRSYPGDWVVDHRMREEGCMIGRRREGVWSGYYPDGAVQWRAEYVSGVLEGRYVEYHKTGEVLREDVSKRRPRG